MKKNILVFGFRFVVGDVISEVGFWPAHVIWPRAQPLDGSILLKF